LQGKVCRSGAIRTEARLFRETAALQAAIHGVRNGTLGIARSFGVLALVWTAFGCGKATDGGASQVVDPGRKDIHRLNSAEYNATVHDLLGTTLQPATHGWRGGELAGFDNIASVLGVDESQYGRYLGAARDLVTEVLASDGLRGRFVACTLADPACVRASIQSAGLRLFRRPLEPEEVTIYQRVYDTGRGLGDDEPAAFGLALQALLASAEFLYRIEIDPQRDSIAAHPLGPFELASRLSYFIWSSAPDDALLATAADGSLTQPGTLAASVDRMLDDPRSERLVTNFAGQWLGAREVLSHPVAPNYVRWSRSVAQAASAEILLYFSDFLRSGRSWLDFPSADVNLVDSALAHFYGMPDSTATEVGVPVRVEYRDDQRAGYFGLAGFLAVSSFDRRTSPSRRGRWIASTLLCSDPPPPPANVPELEEGDPDAGVDPSKLDAVWRNTAPTHAAPPVMRCSTATVWRSRRTTRSASTARATTTARRSTCPRRSRRRSRTPKV
jgi:hypothetical protein